MDKKREKRRNKLCTMEKNEKELERKERMV